MRIGAIAERSGPSVDTLRFCERIGLIPPPALCAAAPGEAATVTARRRMLEAHRVVIRSQLAG